MIGGPERRAGRIGTHEDLQLLDVRVGVLGPTRPPLI